MNDKLNKFERARRAMVELIEENQQLFDQFFGLADKYNAALAEAKEAVRATQPPGPIVVGPFRRSKAPVSVTYDPAKLPTKVLQLSGVVEKVSAEAITEYVMKGEIPADAVKAARTEKEGTAKIDGPAAIVVKL